MFLLDDNLFRVFSILFFLFIKRFLSHIFLSGDFLKRFAPLIFFSGLFRKKICFLFWLFFTANTPRKVYLLSHCKKKISNRSFGRLFSPYKSFRDTRKVSLTKRLQTSLPESFSPLSKRLQTSLVLPRTPSGYVSSTPSG